MKVMRFECSKAYGDPIMDEDPDHGDWVRYEDYERLQEALRKAVNVWDNYRIDSTETERSVKAECMALVNAEKPGPGPDGSHDPAFRWVTIRGTRYGMHNDIANEIDRLREAAKDALEFIKSAHGNGPRSKWCKQVTEACEEALLA